MQSFSTLFVALLAIINAHVTYGMPVTESDLTAPKEPLVWGSSIAPANGSDIQVTKRQEGPAHCRPLNQDNVQYIFFDITEACNANGISGVCCVSLIQGAPPSCPVNYDEASHNALMSGLRDQAMKDGQFETTSSDPWILSFLPGFTAVPDTRVVNQWARIMNEWRTLAIGTPDAFFPRRVQFVMTNMYLVADALSC